MIPVARAKRKRTTPKPEYHPGTWDFLDNLNSTKRFIKAVSDGLGGPPKPIVSPEQLIILKEASNKTLLDAVRAVYDGFLDREGPNINKIVAPVQALLLAQGNKASKRSIQQVARSPEFKSKRREVGKH